MTSGPYQSRLLNFLLRQSRQLIDKSNETARRLKIATVWGAQAMLYPIYALFQTTRIAGKQLGPVGRFMARFRLGAAATANTDQSSHQSSPGSDQLSDVWQADPTAESLTLPAADEPVFNVLQAIKALSLPKVQQRLVKLTVQATYTLDGQPAAGILDMPDSAELAIQRTQIRGIASQILNRALVLISDRNEIVDVFSKAQQQQLRTRIFWELEQYERQIQQIHLLNQSRIRSEALPGKSIRSLLPVQRFQQIMAWVQQSPIAVSLNIFQESALLPSSSARPALPRTTAQSLHLPVPAQLDYTMARLEAADISPIVDSTTSLFQRGKTWLLKHFNRSLSSELSITDTLAATHSSGSEPANTDTAQDWELYAPKPSMPQSWLARLAKPPSLIRRSQPTVPSENAEPSLDELSKKVRSHIANNRRPSSPHSPSAALFSVGSSVASFTQVKQQSTNRKTQASSLSAAQSASLHSSSAAATAQPTALSHQQHISVPDVTWLEAKVSFVGYVKHPLERVLEWLDRIMLWLEDRLINLVKWLKQLWSI